MKWEIRGKVYDLPFKEKKKLKEWVNTNFRRCPHCRKIDCTLKHVDRCSPEVGRRRITEQDHMYN